MKHTSLEIIAGSRSLSQAMRAIRKKRGKTIGRVAQDMGMAVRTYEDFEAGRGPLTDERIIAFAKATDSDAFALILGAMLDMPSLAVDCADTKLVMIMVMQLQQFAEDEGPDLVYLEPGLLISGFERAFKGFGETLHNDERMLQKWLDERTGWIGLSALRLRGVTRSEPDE